MCMEWEGLTMSVLEIQYTVAKQIITKKISAYPARESTPSWILAPPESFSPITGAPTSIALSIILQILRACMLDRLPPNTVKSCIKETLNTVDYIPPT